MRSSRLMCKVARVGAWKKAYEKYKSSALREKKVVEIHEVTG